MSLPQYDLCLLLPTHQTPAVDTSIADKVSRAILEAKKPVAVCVIGNSQLASRIHLEFMANGVPSFPTPERAVHALAAAALVREYHNEPFDRPVRLRRVPQQSGKRGKLSAPEASKLLWFYGMDEPKSVVVRRASDLGELRKLSFPVACKLLSEQLLHKKDVGGVVLGVRSALEARSTLLRFQRLAAKKRAKFGGMLVQEMVADGTELILGCTRDATFGPVVALGAGGTYTEVIRDYALAVAPVGPGEAKRMLSLTKLDRILGGYRGGPKVNLERLGRLVSSFSRIMFDNPSIGQIEVNPLIATARGVLAVDTRVVLDKR